MWGPVPPARIADILDAAGIVHDIPHDIAGDVTGQ